MSCCDVGCNPRAGWPNPNARFGGDRTIKGGHIKRQPRRRAFFSPQLQRASVLVLDPASITLREAAVVLVLGYALYCGYFAVDRVCDAVARTPVDDLCPALTLVQCSGQAAWFVLQMTCHWAAAVVPWAIAAAVTVFFLEEARVVARRKIRM